ncbi:SOS response-associated peptidase [Streptacidiphilus sp. ASG 303]|uniref:SOS response-associated peptidase n=1 Tax=Streptacidiphilus sp. ASG 303 TaxID=2896847 RepID=UPI001E40D564|nr:SOS response-associated peptidase [Streptacidiphilus sp. ASG 303]MCD0482851.1 SOS response-associated peptidase [Streptacidiphilus sp. ASG 303]
MCGRYASGRRPEDLVELFGVERWDPTETIAPDWNVAPTKPVWAVMDRPPKDAPPEGAPPEGADRPVRQLHVLRWGLVPSWSKTPEAGVKMINARAETVHEKPAYRRAFASRRCLLPADGYYEWHTPETAPDGPKGRARKQPYYITPADGSVMAMAGLYEWWRDRSRPADDPGAWLCTCTVLTTDAEDALGRIHPRMPLLVEPGGYDAWLDPDRSDPDELRSLLVPPAAGRLAARPVSPAVNNVRNNGPQLTEPIPADQVLGDATLF